MSTYRRALQVGQRQRDIIDALDVSDCAPFVESTRDEYSDVYIEARAEAGLAARRATHDRWLHAWSPNDTDRAYIDGVDLLIICDTCRIGAPAVGFNSHYRRLMQTPGVFSLSTLAGKPELHVEHYADIECPVSPS